MLLGEVSIRCWTTSHRPGLVPGASTVVLAAAGTAVAPLAAVRTGHDVAPHAAWKAPAASMTSATRSTVTGQSTDRLTSFRTLPRLGQPSNTG